MNIKEIFRTIEGLTILIAFGGVILTGAKMFAWLGLGAYVVINLPNGVQKAKEIIVYLGKKLGFFKAE